MDNYQLIEACKNNKVAAQEAVYKTYAPKVYPVCLKYASCTDDAKDLLQDTFITVFEKVKQFNHQGSFEGWIKRIAINMAIKRYKKNIVYRLHDDKQIENETPQQSWLDGISIEAILGCIMELPNRYRLVFNLYVLDGYKHDEIAELLDISTGTSKSNLARARVILKEKVNALKKNDTAQLKYMS
ncbi:MAG: RNA polymerase sigma factor [Flavobacteriaceae bacterium]|nr:RNA polymerase sigma factor [Flavobacteriaceae bacterium]